MVESKSSSASSRRSLPPQANLEQLKKQAKERLAELRKTVPKATLAKAQFALAREYGFTSWRALKVHIEAQPPALSPKEANAAAVQAASAGKVAELKRVLQAHPQAIHATGGTWNQPLLHLAATKGHQAVVKLLLQKGFDVNTRDKGDNAYALHFAAENGQLEIVKLLVEHGGDIHGLGDDHESGVLGWATCLHGYHEDVANFLITRGCQHHIFSAIAMNDARTVRALVAADPAQLQRRMSPNEHHRQPLHHAGAKNRPDMMRLLMKLGADVHATDDSGATALTYAVEGSDLATLVLLQKAGAKMDLRSALRLKRYDEAAEMCRADPARLGPTGRDTIALHLCTANNDIDGVRWLLAHGVDVNAKRELFRCNHTALHVAVDHDRREIADVLLAAGADLNIRDDKYEATPLGWAEYLNRPEIAQRLRQAGGKA